MAVTVARKTCKRICGSRDATMNGISTVFAMRHERLEDRRDYHLATFQSGTSLALACSGIGH